VGIIGLGRISSDMTYIPSFSSYFDPKASGNVHALTFPFHSISKKENNISRTILYRSLKNSLIIHEENTKEMNV
jgi:hypothetical protein